MKIRPASQHDLEAITEIYNSAVQNTTAIWNENTVDTDNRAQWLYAHQLKGYPVLVVVDDDNQALGYATYDDWRAWDGYRHTIEHSVYVRESAQGKGLGTLLLEELIRKAQESGKHMMVAGISADNTGSIKLHERLGFEIIGTMPQVGAKFGRWLDLTFMQLMLTDVAEPPAS